MRWACTRILLWLIARARRRIFSRMFGAQRVVTFEGLFLFWRFEPFWRDEWISVKADGTRKHYNRPPWWRPFNILLHQWAAAPGASEGWHDHPRWSITLCLRGKLIEKTPWGNKVLTPGSVVLRTHKYIHAFEVPSDAHGHTWTVFIVGRRNHRQNSYVVTPR